jgi:glycosidase
MKKVFFTVIALSIMIFPQVSNQTNNAEDFVPAWAKKAVWYQIFPERFCNGDKTNDPTIETLKGAYPQDSYSPWMIHPWTSDWYKLQRYEQFNGKDIWYNIQRRRYGGDLQGIINKLDYIKDLGVNAIYLTPIFQSPSLHKYDAVTYHHVDPYFGPDPEGDKKLILTENPGNPATWVWTSADKLFLKLIQEVHKRNMKIILDGVFNHMGYNSWPFQDVIKNKGKSLYKDWFTIRSFDDPKKGTKFDYDGWFGTKELPELREDENGIVAGPREYIFNITKRWMDPENNGDLTKGLDGWRLDVAYCINHNFWKAWRKHVKSINPNAYITAELVDPPEATKPYLAGDEFDAVMNYNFLYDCAEFFSDEKTAITPVQFDNLLKELREAFPACVSYVQMNLNNSHDTERLLTSIVNRDKYKIRDWGPTFDKRKGSNPNYDTRKPNEEELKTNKLIAIFKFTYIGAPYIYYGEEAGMWGANDPDERKPMVWEDLVYENEQYMPDQSVKKNDKVEFNKDLFSLYKKLASIRSSEEALQLGTFNTISADDNNNTYIFSRQYSNSQIIVVLNNSKSEREITFNTSHKEYFKDLLNGSNYNVDTSKGTLTVKIPARWGGILKAMYYK